MRRGVDDGGGGCCWATRDVAVMKVGMCWPLVEIGRAHV